MTTVCTYDNPETWRRECWQDGRLLCFYSASLYFLKVWPIPARLYFFGANIGSWKTGQMIGDPAAMEKPPDAVAVAHRPGNTAIHPSWQGTRR